MADPLVVPGVVRYTIRGTYAGQPLANIVDMDIDTDFGNPRNANVSDQAKIIISAWVDNVLPNLSDRVHATDIAWVDMNRVDGTTGVESLGTGSDFPANGALGGQAMPGNCAFLIHKNVTSARGSRSGRMFLPGVEESATSALLPNQLDGGWVDDINAGMAQFLDDINQTGGVYGSQMVVVHTKNTAPKGEKPIIEYVSQSEVQSLTCDPIVGSQRRRMPPRG